MGEVALGEIQTWPVRGPAASPKLSGNPEPLHEKSDQSCSLQPARLGRQTCKGVGDTRVPLSSLWNAVAQQSPRWSKASQPTHRIRKNKFLF